MSNMEKLLTAMKAVRAIITEGAMTGFNPLEGNWADKLFHSQAMSHDAVQSTELTTVMEWQKIGVNGFGINDIDLDAYYVVQTNGGEWRDFDLAVMHGQLIARRIAPDYVRGRPVWIAKINRPKEEQK